MRVVSGAVGRPEEAGASVEGCLEQGRGPPGSVEECAVLRDRGDPVSAVGDVAARVQRKRALVVKAAHHEERVLWAGLAGASVADDQPAGHPNWGRAARRWSLWTKDPGAIWGVGRDHERHTCVCRGIDVLWHRPMAVRAVSCLKLVPSGC